ncbi:hypothetical protein EMIT0P253_440011 [Pseudomonas sp. IT-P253]
MTLTHGLRETHGQLSESSSSTVSARVAVTLYSAFGVHLAMVVKTERFLWLAEQFGFFRLVFVEGQTATIQVLQCQFPGFFRGEWPQFR